MIRLTLVIDERDGQVWVSGVDYETISPTPDEYDALREDVIPLCDVIVNKEKQMLVPELI